MSEKFGPKLMPVDMPHWRSMVERRLSNVTAKEAGTQEGGYAAKDAYARRISRQLAARTFVQEYIASGFSLDQAYRALRPNATRRAVAKKAWRWLKEPFVVELLAKYDKARDRNAKVNLAAMREAAIGDAEASVMDFIKFDPERKTYHFDLNPSNYTPQQRRRLKGVKIFQGEIVEVRVPDSIAARKQALEIELRMSGETSGALGSMPTRAFGQQLKHQRTQQAAALRALAKATTKVPQLHTAITQARSKAAQSRANAIEGEF